MKQIIKSIVAMLILLQSLCSMNAQQTFLTAIPTESSLLATLPSDFYVQPKGAWASNYQNGSSEGPIALSYDRNMGTIYHSSWNNTVFPVTLDYYFAETAEQIDYLVYYPRTSGSNGHFKTVEIWYAANGQPLTKYGDFDFMGTSDPKTVTFKPALVRPDTIRFVVKSGAGDGNGFASCAEMEFYRKAPNSFDYSTIFADELCTALKPGITPNEINAVSEGFYKKLASDMYYGFFDTEFRVQEFRAWEHPDKKAAKNKTAAYSLRDNPAGIYVSQAEDLVIFVGEIPMGQSLSLITQDLSTGGWGTQMTYSLKQGLNKIRMVSKGLVYVQYYNDAGAAAPKVKMNFVTGRVNGYFDNQKHSAADWTRLLSKAAGPDFDVLDEFVHLTFPVSNFKTLTDGPAFIATWNQLVIWEHEFMGLYKYPEHKYQNRVYCHIDYNSQAAYMYASSYHTGYSPGSISSIIKQDWYRNEVWGPAHEIGHVNQVRPGVRWLGMTEVTNNIYSLHVQTSFGNTSRLEAEKRYTGAFANLVTPPIAHQNIGNGDVFYQLVPFWQLKLYLVDVLGKEDFYKDLFHHYMTTADPTTPETDGRYQLNFVRVACDIAQLDLTEFFEKWGFLTPINKTITDYGSAAFIVTAEQVAALKAEIAAKNYQKPARDFSRITDSNKESYKN